MSTVEKVASSNWLSLQKTLNKRSNSASSHPRKRRKLDNGSSESTISTPSTHTNITTTAQATSTVTGLSTSAASPILITLRNMIQGLLTYTPSQYEPGKYLTIDCEMVGIGLEGSESSLARVSIVNWYGAVQLDVYVRQRERVVDYRTQWSGIREKDMVGAKPFEQVQKLVADLIKDRILVGHAVHNDLKVLLLSHPRPMLRDTQVYAHKFNLTKSKRIALRNLIKDQIGITIQESEHDSVTDARATMAVYRLHKNEWEKGSLGRPQVVSSKSRNTTATTSTANADINSTPQSRITTKKRVLSGPDKTKVRAAAADVQPDSDSASDMTSSSSSTSEKINTIMVSQPTTHLIQARKPFGQNTRQKRQNRSSGLSIITKRRIPNTTTGNKTVLAREKVKLSTSTSSSVEKTTRGTGTGEKKAWWTELSGPSVSPGAGGRVAKKKGSIRVVGRTS